MGTFLFEIITLYSLLKARLMIVGKESIKKYFNMIELSIVKDNHFLGGSLFSVAMVHHIQGP